MWQGRQDSNPRHAVLETAVLPVELRPYILATNDTILIEFIVMVEGEGFEPSKLPQRIYSPPHLATLVPLHCGASDRSRTCDLLITSQLLYLLSYAGTSSATRHNLSHPSMPCQPKNDEYSKPIQAFAFVSSFSDCSCTRDTERNGTKVEIACL